MSCIAHLQALLGSSDTKRRRPDIYFADADYDSSQSSTTADSICQGYSVESYASMNNDAVRNRFFDKAIAGAVARRGKLKQQFDGRGPVPHHWLEIGCGGSALLTKRVLALDQNSTIEAFETNAQSAKEARRTLNADINLADRWQVRSLSSCAADAPARSASSSNNSSSSNSSSSSDITDSSSKRRRKSALPAAPQAAIFEIFGYIASAEGVVRAIADLRTRHRLPATAAVVPERAATFYAPVCLDAEALHGHAIGASGSLYVSDKLLLLQRLDFSRCMASTAVGVFEALDFRGDAPTVSDSPHAGSDSDSSNSSGSTSSDSSSSSSTASAVAEIAAITTSTATVFIVSRSCTVHGLGMYVALAARGTAADVKRWAASEYNADWSAGELWTSSNISDGRYSSNWRNPVALFSEPLNLHAGDTLHCTVTTAVHSEEPQYSMVYSVEPAAQAAKTARTTKTAKAAAQSKQQQQQQQQQQHGEISLSMSDLYPDFVKARSEDLVEE
jgi:hypothetical protein